MRKILSLVAFVLLPLAAAGADIAEPFKVGTFEIDGSAKVGIVLRDSLIVELDAANLALEKNSRYPQIPLPADMIELISRYEYGLKKRGYNCSTRASATP
jgi:hypothetical protein